MGSVGVEGPGHRRLLLADLRVLSELDVDHHLQIFAHSINCWYTHWIRAVIETMASIPIPLPFVNFGMELTSNSNSSFGIGAATPTPIQRSGDDSNVF